MNYLLSVTILAGMSTLAINTFAACTAASDITLQRPDTQYIDHADGTVTDVGTGLMWKKCSEGQTYSAGACTGSATANTWQWALQAPALANANQGSPLLGVGYTDWRLPNVNELGTLVDRACGGTQLRINTTLFPSMPTGNSSLYWATTTYGINTTSNPSNAWYVRFDTGVENVTIKDSARSARLVRGPLPGYQ